MKSTFGNRTLDSELTGHYRRLLRNLGLLVLAIVVLTTSTVVYFELSSSSYR